MARFSIRPFLHRFARDEEGSIAVESLLMIPMLFWAVVAGYTFFDGYRQSAANLKAAYTIGDLISRETQEINDTYIDSMQDLMTLMVASGSEVDMRISLIRFDEEDNRHYVNWSAIRGFTKEWTDENITSLSDQLPPMPDADTLILIETSNEYIPAFDMGLDIDKLENFIFTRPRFTNEIAGNV